jgi:hypothetical protein
MEKVRSTSNVTIGVILSLTEQEARALHAITQYGSKEFIKTFYEHMGKSVLQPHEEGLISLFQTIRDELPRHINRADQARDIWRNAAKNEAK